MTITGSVKYLDFEGGFWGIVGDDDQKYRPVNELPPATRQDGCRVRAEIEPANVISFAMWGQNVKLLNVEKL